MMLGNARNGDLSTVMPARRFLTSAAKIKPTQQIGPLRLRVLGVKLSVF
jgi:hypothetical protein